MISRSDIKEKKKKSVAKREGEVPKLMSKKTEVARF